MDSTCLNAMCKCPLFSGLTDLEIENSLKGIYYSFALMTKGN